MTSTTQPGRPGHVHRAGRLLVLGAVAMAFLPVPRVQAADTICVALVVDFSTLNNGPVDSGCTRVPPGSTGYDVLRAGGHTYEICSNGIIGTIDGKPANGCQIKDDTHFWGYWHRKPGSRTWTFSSYGAGVYHPAEGSTEGWVWEDGSTTPPADVPYPAGCHTPPTSPSPSPSSTPHAAPAADPSTSSTLAPGAVAGSGHAAATTAPRSGHQRHASASASAAASTSAGSTAASSGTPGSVASPTASDQRTATTTSDAGANHAAPLVAGVAVAVLLAAGAWWRFRRSRSP